MEENRIKVDRFLTGIYNPITLHVDSGETISVAQRDDGFEIVVPDTGKGGKIVFIKNGQVDVKNLIEIRREYQDIRNMTLGQICQEVMEEKIFKDIPFYRRWLSKLMWKYF